MNKASSPDEKNAGIETAHEITPSLCDLRSILKLLRLGSLPTEWKLASIVPVYKKAIKEYIDKDQVYSLVGSCQHGFMTFMAKRSCVTQLVEVLDLIGCQLDKGGGGGGSGNYLFRYV